MAEPKHEKLPLSKAVALKYDADKDPAPRVVAKGQGAIAEQIVKVAESLGITVQKNADLVEVLAKLEIDAIIPLEAYAAVAEILRYVYKMNSSAKTEKEFSS